MESENLIELPTGNNGLGVDINNVVDMKPQIRECKLKYYSDYINKIICGDCLTIMRQMPDKCLDLVVTSPPYN
jgi:hypothetical protein